MITESEFTSWIGQLTTGRLGVPVYRLCRVLAWATIVSGVLILTGTSEIAADGRKKKHRLQSHPWHRRAQLDEPAAELCGAMERLEQRAFLNVELWPGSRPVSVDMLQQYFMHQIRECTCIGSMAHVEKDCVYSAHVNPESPHLGHQVCDGSHRNALQMSQAMSPTNPMHKVNSTGLLQSGSYVSDLENEANVYLELPWIPWIAAKKFGLNWFSRVIVDYWLIKVKILAWSGFAQFSPQLQQHHDKKKRRNFRFLPRLHKVYYFSRDASWNGATTSNSLKVDEPSWISKAILWLKRGG